MQTVVWRRMDSELFHVGPLPHYNSWNVYLTRSGYLSGERWAWNVLVSKFDNDVIFSGACRHVRHWACAVLVVLARDLCLWWTLHGESEAARAGVLGDDGEVARLARDSVTQTRAVRVHVTACHGIHVELEWVSCWRNRTMVMSNYWFITTWDKHTWNFIRDFLLRDTNGAFTLTETVVRH